MFALQIILSGLPLQSLVVLVPVVVNVVVLEIDVVVVVVAVQLISRCAVWFWNVPSGHGIHFRISV